MPIIICESDLHALKRRIGVALPMAKHGRAIEILAKTLGYNTYAAMRADLAGKASVAIGDDAFDPNVIGPVAASLIGGHASWPESEPNSMAFLKAALRSVTAPFSTPAAEPPKTESERLAAKILRKPEIPGQTILHGLTDVIEGRAPHFEVRIKHSRHGAIVARRIDKENEVLPGEDVLELTFFGRETPSANIQGREVVAAIAKRLAITRGIAVVIAVQNAYENKSHVETLMEIAGTLADADGYADISGAWDAHAAWIVKFPADHGVEAWRPYGDGVGAVIAHMAEAWVTEELQKKGATNDWDVLNVAKAIACRVIVKGKHDGGAKPTPMIDGVAAAVGALSRGDLKTSLRKVFGEIDYPDEARIDPDDAGAVNGLAKLKPILDKILSEKGDEVLTQRAARASAFAAEVAAHFPEDARDFMDAAQDVAATLGEISEWRTENGLQSEGMTARGLLSLIMSLAGKREEDGAAKIAFGDVRAPARYHALLDRAYGRPPNEARVILAIVRVGLIEMTR